MTHNTFDKEQIYDELISPHMKAIAEICQKHDIHMLSDFFIGNTDEKPNLHVTTYIESKTNNSVNTENAAKLLRNMVTKEDRDNGILIAALHHAVSYAHIDMDDYSVRLNKYLNFKAGDWVIETSALVFQPPQLNIFGKVLEINNGEHTKKILIRTINGQTVEWNNCRFLKIPHSNLLDKYLPEKNITE